MVVCGYSLTNTHKSFNLTYYFLRLVAVVIELLPFVLVSVNSVHRSINDIHCSQFTVAGMCALWLCPDCWKLKLNGFRLQCSYLNTVLRSPFSVYHSSSSNIDVCSSTVTYSILTDAVFDTATFRT